MDWVCSDSKSIHRRAIAASVWPLVQETGRLLGLDLGDQGENQVQSALNEVGALQGAAGYSVWMRDTGVIDGSLRIQLEPWFDQSLTIGGRKGRPSKLDGVRVSVEHILEAKIHGLETVEAKR